MTGTRREWTEEEFARAVALRAAGHSYGAIDKMLGRRYGSSGQKLTYLCTYSTVTKLPPYTTALLIPPAAVIADRDHRINLQPQSVTAALMGDPPAGYSALDRRNQVHAFKPRPYDE